MSKFEDFDLLLYTPLDGAATTRTCVYMSPENTCNAGQLFWLSGATATRFGITDADMSEDRGKYVKIGNLRDSFAELEKKLLRSI